MVLLILAEEIVETTAATGICGWPKNGHSPTYAHWMQTYPEIPERKVSGSAQIKESKGT
jgi:hypothetical protein